MKRIFSSIIILLIFLSCNNSTNRPNANQEVATAKEHQHKEQAAPLKLNEGEKWLVNNEMKPSVLTGENLVNTYLLNKGTNYSKLAAQLKAQNMELIKSCTMEGESHNELHKWIYPHIGLVAALEKEEDKVKATETVIQLQKSYQLYHQYFN